MDNEKSQHTLWLKMAGVHWAHYFSLLTLICWLKKKQMCTFPTFSDRNKAFCFFGGIMRDCKIILMLHISREKKFTKQNKELPSIPLCTYYNLSYPVTQREPHHFNISTFTFFHYFYLNFHYQGTLRVT